MMDMKRVDLNLLVSLDTLLDELNVTRAAQRLHISQPALSAQLSRLRESFGDPLLLPAESGRGMVATARALALRAPLRALLHNLEGLLQPRAPFDPVTAEHVFRFAASDNASISLVLPLAERLRRDAGPGIRVSFRTLDQRRIGEQIEAGEIEFLLGSENALLPFMRSTRLLQEHWVMAQRKGHPRGTGVISLDEYCALQHVLVSPSGGGFSGRVDEALAATGAHRHIVISVQQFMVALSIVQVTDYVCALPSRLVERYRDTLDAIELPVDAGGFTLHLAWHSRNHVDPAHQWMRNLISLLFETRAAQM